MAARVVVAVAGVGMLATAATPAVGEESPEPHEIVVEDGITQPVFSYADAVREVVQVESPVSSHDGDEPDIINVDIIRPAASDGDLRVPTIIIPSPYYSGPGRGGTVNRAGERKPTPPATPSIVAGDRHFGGERLSTSLPVTGQAGELVDCGEARSPGDCPSDVTGGIALIEGRGNSSAEKIQNAAEAGAAGAVIYGNRDETPVDDAPIAALAVSRDAGLALLDLGPVEANLRELVEPIDAFPLYYDNIFVPRGYAVAQVDLPGSRYSTGCLDVGGPAEVGAAEAVVEWLSGEGYAVDGTTGQEVTAHWSNGLSAMIGKSWDGTIPIGVAARAPEGLATIVPIAGLSHWQSDFWSNGARYGGSATQWFDGNSNNPSMRPEGSGPANAGRCSENRAHLAAEEENPDPDSEFWQERNWVKDVADFEASVFVVHGKNDDNVKPVNYGHLYEALAEYGVPRKIWLAAVEHQKAFDFRREEWVVTIHRWFDYWLHGIDNGIVDEPRADVDSAPHEWATYDDWPNGTLTRLWLGTPRDVDDPRPGTLWTDPRYSVHTRDQTFHEVRRSQGALVENPFRDADERLVFLSPVLSEPVHLSGQPEVTVETRVDGEDATFSAFLVDYGTAERVHHTGPGATGGIMDRLGSTCFGEGIDVDTGCYPNVTLRTHIADQEVVTRGWVNAAFHLGEDELDTDRRHELAWGLQHHDYVFEAGHRIGLVISGPETRLRQARHPTTNNEIEVVFGRSSVELPVVGGLRALREAFRG